MKFIRKIGCAVIALCMILAFSATGCNDKPLETTDETVTINADAMTELLVSPENGTCYQQVGETATKQQNTRFSSLVLPVSVGEKYFVSFATSNKNVYGILLTDGDDKVIDSLMAYKDDKTNYIKSYDNVQITVSQGVEKIIINSDVSKAIEVKRGTKEQKTIKKQDALKSELRIACLNCGQFDHENDGSATERRTEWESMVADFKADLFMFEDSLDQYAEGILANDVITRDGQSVYTGCSEARGNVRLAASYKPNSVAIVPFDYSIAGSTKTTERCFAVRFTYFIGNKEVAFYGLHLVAEAHISEAQQDDGSSLSQKLRQIQFAQLIADGKNYDECVFMGDFNAQRADEYNVFTSNGFTITNCSEKYGVTATLRNIPADNIIVSGGITVKNFTVDNIFDIGNTDHLPLYAQIEIA